ncbi:MAG TPA: transposase [Cyclobacteriaceae bacterium]|nr:transposase [Cyclobacteriaceae bacterium]
MPKEPKTPRKTEDKKLRISRALIYELLRQYEEGKPVEEVCKAHNIPVARFYYWKDLYKPESVEVQRKLKWLEEELKHYEVALLLQAEQIRVLNSIIKSKFNE